MTDAEAPHPEPTNAEVRDYLEGARRNWGRWGANDERGALNLLTPERILAGIQTVRAGKVIRLGRPIATWTGVGNAIPSQHFMRMDHHGGDNRVERSDRQPGGSGSDYYGMAYHGINTTHLDALSHAWDADGIYGGHDPDAVYGYNGVGFGGVQHWSTGIVARAVLLDIPRFRGVEFVTAADPVHGWELQSALDRAGVELSPGDAVAIYCGRDRWQEAHPDTPYGRAPLEIDSRRSMRSKDKPGLHASCLPFLRDHDVSTLLWDMLDATPYPYDVTYTVHGAISAYGMALVDNVTLEELSDECASRGRSEFLLVVAPLVVEGGTGSPVNPLAIL